MAICMSAPSASRRAKVVPPKQVGQHLNELVITENGEVLSISSRNLRLCWNILITGMTSFCRYTVVTCRSNICWCTGEALGRGGLTDFSRWVTCLLSDSPVALQQHGLQIMIQFYLQDIKPLDRVPKAAMKWFSYWELYKTLSLTRSISALLLHLGLDVLCNMTTLWSRFLSPYL